LDERGLLRLALGSTPSFIEIHGRSVLRTESYMELIRHLWRET
jgi:hypothetical protein